MAEKLDPSSAGYYSMNPGLYAWANQNQGANFGSSQDAYSWMLGPGSMVSGESLRSQGYDAPGESYYQRQPGSTYQTKSIDYTPPDSLWDMAGLGIIGGIVGAGALAGGLGAGAGAAGGLEGVAGAGAGAGFDVGAGLGGLEGVAGSGGAVGGAAGGFSWTDPSTWFGNTPPTPTGFGGDAGAGSGFDIGGGEGALSGTAGAGASGGKSMLDFLSGLGGNNWLNFAGQGLSGILQFLGSKQAAEIQSQYGQQALALIAQQMAQNQANAQPWINAGTAGLNNAGGLLGLPGYDAVDFTKTPGYQFRYDEGMKQLENQLRAGGKFYSGDALKGTQQYAQNFATNEFSNALNRDLALAGLGQTSVSNLGSLNTTGTNNAANMLTGIGNVEAAGRASGYNALGGAISGALNTYNQNNLLQALLGRGY